MKSLFQNIDIPLIVSINASNVNIMFFYHLVEAGQSDEDSSSVADMNTLKVMTPEVGGHAEIGSNSEVGADEGGAYPVNMYSAVGNNAQGNTAVGGFSK